MNWVSVVSSNLSAVAYEPSNSTLYIRFKGSGTYAYYGVPASVHRSLMSAASHGEYHAAFIKNRYRYAKL
ncbi:KTSC domain-containing protein [Paenibacillus tianmuensis]|uniref:KTSC domain-containing protein n=1 Tax=Paenibacillus tianmuensis TaxID=624147 RepID=A0A1G4TXX7_9BACL|nr:KTSC domain-containing protein [Paenibacillus tianmuensis]SCW86211.1 KTSC domain-containing protein [Paenibacillus tianmuensis]